ncbi:MAG: hypothetical protein ABWY64_16590, partial [Tardiphaga sp.]
NCYRRRTVARGRKVVRRASVEVKCIGGEGKACRLCKFAGQGEPSHHMPNGTALIAAYALRRLRLPFNVHVRP